MTISPPPPTKHSYILSPAPLSSIPKLSHISSQAFKTDTHTQLKELCSSVPKSNTKPDLHASSMASALTSWMSLPKGKVVVLQAIKQGSCEIVGWAAWAGKGIEGGLRWDGDGDATQDIDQEGISKDEVGNGDEAGDAEGEEEEDDNGKPTTSPQIQALETLTDSTMSFWASHFSSPSSSSSSSSSSPSLSPPAHLILISLVIAPSHQGRGIGSSLINWGTRIADRQGAFCWVSSSDGGWGVFERAGFREVGSLRVDLDEFAFGEDGGRVRRPNMEGKEGDMRWGIYTWRWMKRNAVVVF